MNRSDLRFLHTLRIFLSTLTLLLGIIPSGQAAWQCQPHPVGPGPEDFEVYRYPNGETRLLISSARRGSLFSTPSGSILSAVLPPNGGIGAVQKLSLVDPQGNPWKGEDDFHPVGVSLTRSQDTGWDQLYAVNIGGDTNVIEIFDIDLNDPRQLIWVKTLEDPLLDQPNDLLALPDGRIYVTNMFNSEASVVLYGASGGNKWQWRNTGAPAMKFANGIAISQTADRLYVADFQSSLLFMLLVDPATGLLNGDYCTVQLPAHPDNLTWGDKDHRVLYIAAHTSYLRSALHLFLGLRSPSQVLRIDTGRIVVPAELHGGPCDSEGTPVENVIPNEALQEINAASNALRFDDRVILVGQLKEGQIFECREVR